MADTINLTIGGGVGVGDTALAALVGGGTVLPAHGVPTADARKPSDRLEALRSPGREPLKAELPTVKGDKQTAIIRLYCAIDSWGYDYGISAKEFVDILDGLPESTETIKLLINSPGGECSEAIAIINALRSHDARVVAVVEGLAASAASVIACAADELIMQPNTDLFLHEAWGLCIGPAADMQTMADELNHFSNNIASIYAAKAGGTTEDWRAVMTAETWFSAQEAVDVGLADSVGDKPADDKAKNRFDRSIFKFSGRANAPRSQASATVPSSPPRPGQKGAPTMDVTEFREALGLPEDTSDEDVHAAVLDRLNAPPPTPEPAPAAELPEGVVAISEAQLEELRNDAQAGRDARAQQIQTERNALVDAAVHDGRIAPAERDAWLAKLDAGTGAEKILAALKPGVIPVDQLGLGGTADLDTEFAEYAALYGKEA